MNEKCWWAWRGLDVNPDRPVVPEQLGAFLRYQFICLTPTDAPHVLESAPGTMLNPDEVDDTANISAHEGPKHFSARNV